jgi:hypothetical protein
MKTHHYFDARDGVPPYWLRTGLANNPRDIEVHRQMVREHERIHRHKKEQSK